MVRAAAKNHASVAIVSSPARYKAVLAAIAEQGGVPPGLRAALAIDAFRQTAAYDARIAAELPPRMAAAGVELPDEPGLPGAADPYPETLTIALEKVETLRYGENPHQPAARYRRAGTVGADGPFSSADAPLQGKQLSYNNVLDASAAAALARRLDGPGCVIVKHTNPCGAAERETLPEAWAAALAGDPVSAFGGVVALTREIDRPTAEGLASIFLEVIVAPGFDAEARDILATKPNLRLVVDRSLASTDRPVSADPTGSIRTAGGAFLVTAPDTIPDDPTTWQVATTRRPTDAEQLDLELAWRLVRGATSNAIVLVRDGRLIGLGSGQTSRVDAARQAVDKALAISGEAVLRGAACASDAFYPFPDGVDVCLAAGVSAYVQPGGSMRDDDVIAAAERAGATMVLTGVRHFRH
jgi:phosphoribosylaminoimidazolecarboxamide formyltransferase/IMP cyclohydrolase